MPSHTESEQRKNKRRKQKLKDVMKSFKKKK